MVVLIVLCLGVSIFLAVGFMCVILFLVKLT